MGKLRRLILVRHGETVDGSGRRLIGSGDPDLSEAGRAQMRQGATALRHEIVDLVAGSPLRRSWQSAAVLLPGAPIRLEPAFRERHFGRWEGLTGEEIEAADPVLCEDWKSGKEGFEFPGGEPRGEFQERIRAGLERLLAAPARSALLVVHKGVIREIVAHLTGEALSGDRPALGEAVTLTRAPDGTWFVGCRSSNPPDLDAAA